MTKEEAYKKCRVAFVSISQALQDRYNGFSSVNETMERIKDALNKAPAEHW